MTAPIGIPWNVKFSWAELSDIAGADNKMVQASVVGKENAALFAQMRAARGADYIPHAAAALCRMLQAKVDSHTALGSDPALQKTVMDTISQVLKRAFAEPEAATLSFRHMIQRANAEAREVIGLLDGLERQAVQNTMAQEGEPWPDIPQVGLTSDGGVSLLQDKPKPETLVLKGGGCKGIGYVMTFKTLAREQMLSEVKNVVGTSIGAITSAGIACGLSVTGGGRGETDESELGTYLTDVCDPSQDMKYAAKGVLPGLRSSDDQSIQRMYPDITTQIPGGGGSGVMKGYNVFRTIELTLAKSVNQVLRGHGLPDSIPPEWETPPGGGPLSNAQKERLRQLSSQDMSGVDPRQNQPGDRTGLMITFRDIQLLARLAPDKFKNLAITAYCSNHGKTLFLDARSAPDVPVALAARASMALPMLYSPVTFTYQGRNCSFYDGGVGNNMPIDYAIRLSESDMTDEEIRGAGAMAPDRARSLAVARSKVMALALDGKGSAYTALHEPVSPDNTQSRAGFFTKMLTRLFARQGNYNRTLLQDRERVAAHGSRHTLIVPHDGVGTGSFGNMQNSRVRQGVYIASTVNTLKFLDARENKGYQLNVSAEEFNRDAGGLARHIPENKKEAFRRRLAEAAGLAGGLGANLDPAALRGPVRAFIMDKNALSDAALRQFISFGSGREDEARMALAKLWDAM